MFGNKPRGNHETTWVNFNGKVGAFQIGSKKANTLESFNTMEDALVRRVMIRETPNYKDKTKMDKLISISFRSSEGKDAVVNFALSQFAVKVLGLINAADLSKPITLGTGVFAAGTEDKDLTTGETRIREEDQAFLVGYQNGEKLKAKFSDDPEFKIPKVDVIEVKHPVTGDPLDSVRDTRARDEFILTFAKEVNDKVAAVLKNQPAPKPATPAPDAGDGVREEGPTLSPADFADGGEADEHAFAEAPTVG
jgi:hypothetical protein